MRQAIENPSQDPRRPYEKPLLQRVALRPEEAVLGACKTNGNATCLLNSTAGS